MLAFFNNVLSISVLQNTPQAPRESWGTTAARRHALLHSNIWMYRHTHARTHTHTHTHTHKHTHTHTETHTHKPAEDWKENFGKHTVSVHAKVISVVCAAVLDPEAYGECLIVLVYFWAIILCVGVQALSPAIWIGLQWWCIPLAGITVSAGFLKANCPSVIVHNIWHALHSLKDRSYKYSASFGRVNTP